MLAKIHTIVYTPRDILRTRAQHPSIPRVIELWITSRLLQVFVSLV